MTATLFNQIVTSGDYWEYDLVVEAQQAVKPATLPTPEPDLEADQALVWRQYVNRLWDDHVWTECYRAAALADYTRALTAHPRRLTDLTYA